jgi:hypothetical protein
MNASTYNREQVVTDMLSGIDDLGQVSRAIVREEAIRDGMARTGQGREPIAEAIDAMDAMDQEAILDLTEGDPTTLVDALTRYVRILQDGDEIIPRDQVVGDLSAILEYSWSGEEKLVQLHNPHYGLALHIAHTPEGDLVVKMGNNRREVARVTWEDAGSGGVLAAEYLTQAVYRATLARVIADRDHHVQLDRRQLMDLLAFLDRPSGSWSADRVTVDACGDGVLVRTRPYTYQSAAVAEQRRIFESNR